MSLHLQAGAWQAAGGPSTVGGDTQQHGALSEPACAKAEATIMRSASLNSCLGQESGKPTFAFPVKPCNYT